MNDYSNKTIINFAYNSWSDMWKGNQQRLHRLSKVGYKVLFVDPMINFKGIDLKSLWFNWMKIFSDNNHVDGNVLVYKPYQIIPLINKFSFLAKLDSFLRVLILKSHLRKLNSPSDIILWINRPLEHYSLYKKLLNPKNIVLDWSDDWTAHDIYLDNNPSSSTNADVVENIAADADLVITVSEILQKKALKLNNNSHYMRNATDCELFAKCLDSNLEAADRLKEIKRPILGYIGYIVDRLDFDVLEYLAKSRPDWSIVLIGPVMKTCTIPETLQKHENIHFTGAVPFAELPPYLKAFDVCLIPHIDDEPTRAGDPLKLYNYLAAGKPVVTSTASRIEEFKEIEGIVYIAKTKKQFLEMSEKALLENDSELIQKRIECAKNNSYEARTERIINLLKEVGV